MVSATAFVFIMKSPYGISFSIPAHGVMLDLSLIKQGGTVALDFHIVFHEVSFLTCLYICKTFYSASFKYAIQ